MKNTDYIREGTGMHSRAGGKRDLPFFPLDHLNHRSPLRLQGVKGI